MSSPLISILTPFKNSEAYISECIESVINQSFKDWEMILVDDHSTDDSKKLVIAYTQRDNRIKCMNNSGNGIIDALRTALEFSSGAMISRMDSDDIMMPLKLETMKSQLEESGPGHIALGLVKYFPASALSEGYSTYEKWLNGLTAEGSNFSELYKECVIPSPCWMTYRGDLLKCGAFNENLYPEDYDLTFRFFEGGLNCLPSNEVLHLWRDYPSRTSKTHVHYQQEYFLDLKTHYFLKLHYDDQRPLTLWGAGNKGKHIAGLLNEQGIRFFWISHNPEKIGKRILGQPILKLDDFDDLKAPQSIITVANEGAQQEIALYLKKRDFQPMTDYFFFC